MFFRVETSTPPILYKMKYDIVYILQAAKAHANSASGIIMFKGTTNIFHLNRFFFLNLYIATIQLYYYRL